ncbi:Bro-N domain-containing protein [Bacillus hominis]|uniref:BRO-N domain-containing protein n=1 Tax=Bacillus hominis TaxID=2817478 RepID=UPI0025A0A7BF|nr:Bro-N domain-containing protein [Bacillus hominis]MDM5432349.1 Bro-N domain-containing protein [Bacillus hominis]
MSQLQLFHEQEVLGRNFKVYGTKGEPFFLAKDVAEWIEHSKVSMMLQSVDEDEKVKVSNVYSENRSGGNGTWMLTENGVYEVLMQSRKPIAKQFKKQVKAILKDIRLNGGYIATTEEDDEKLSEVIVNAGQKLA